MSVAEAWGLRCPGCGRDDKFDIETKITVRLFSNGTDRFESECQDEEWDDGSACRCCACDKSGKVSEFKIASSGG